MTLGTLRTSISSKLGLDNTAASAEQVLIDQWCNEGVVDVLLQTRCYVTSATMALTAGEDEYTLSTSILHIADIELTAGGAVKRFQMVSPAEILEMRRRGASSADDPFYYAVAGSNMLMVYPTPTSAGTLTVYYTARPTVMSDAAHDPSNTTYGGVPTEFHKAIELYALWQGAEYDNHTPSKNGKDFQEDYEKRLRRYRRHVNLKGNTVLAPARVNLRRRRLVADPGTDTGY